MKILPKHILKMICGLIGLTVANTVPAQITLQTQATSTLVTTGSNSLQHVMQAWMSHFSSEYPQQDFHATFPGSETAMGLLTSGQTDFALMSRPLTSEEIYEFHRNHSYEPTVIPIALDALAVYVHKQNQLTGLTLQELDRIFSQTRLRGGRNIINWELVGGTDNVINLYGRNKTSGTYHLFKQKVLIHGEYKETVHSGPTSDAVMIQVANDRYGLGYNGIASGNENVKSLPLSRGKGEPFYEASLNNIMSGDYPLTRFMFLVVNKKPNQKLQDNMKQFMAFILSPKGQAIANNHGLIPLPDSVISKSMSQIEGKI